MNKNNRWLARIVALMGGVSLAALSGGCSSVPGTAQFRQAPPPGYSYQRPFYYDAPRNYAAGNGYRAPSPPAPSWQHDLGKMADGAAVGAVGGMMAGRAMAGREGGGQVANRALTGAESHAAARGAEAAAEKGAAKMAVAGVERSVVARGADGAAAVGAVEATEGEVILDRVLIWIAERWWLELLL